MTLKVLLQDRIVNFLTIFEPFLLLSIFQLSKNRLKFHCLETVRAYGFILINNENLKY